MKELMVCQLIQKYHFKFKIHLQYDEIQKTKYNHNFLLQFNFI